MKATALLERQHRKVETMFKQLEKGKPDAAILEQLANDLACHMAIEQNIFYPAVREYDEDLIGESFEEHALAEIALKRLLRCNLSDPSFQPKLAALKDLIDHHVEEEEKELFPDVEKGLGDKELERLGKKMQKAFDDAQKAGFAHLVPHGFSQTSADEARKVTARAATNGHRSAAHR